MANADIKQFLFYLKYLWSPTDFQNLQSWLQSETRGIAEGAFGGAVLSGLQPSAGGGLNVNIASGIAVDPNGRIIVIDSTSVTVDSPVGNPAKTLIVARPKLTNSGFIPEPTQPSNSVPLHQDLDYDIVVLNGTPAPNPTFPATQAGDVVLVGINLTAGHATVVYSNFDFSAVNLPKQVQRSIRQISSNYTVVSSDSHIDVDATSNDITVTLPAASGFVGREVEIVKNDSSGNYVEVTSPESISGEASQYIEDQWGSARFKSIGTTWRML